MSLLKSWSPKSIGYNYLLSWLVDNASQCIALTEHWSYKNDSIGLIKMLKMKVEVFVLNNVFPL